MGTKFGNLHVKTADIAEVISALKELASENSVNSTHGDEAFANLLHEANMQKNIFYVGSLQPEWVSVLNDWFGWGEVESVGEALSGYLASPVLTCSYFDDDVLEINLYRNGECLTGQLWSSHGVAEDYGLEHKEADISILSEYLGHNRTEQIKHALELEDQEEAVQAFEQILQLPLWIHSDWFDDMEEEEFVGKYIKHDLNA